MCWKRRWLLRVTYQVHTSVLGCWLTWFLLCISMHACTGSSAPYHGIFESQQAAAADLEACALAAVVFADPEKYAGKVIPVAREAISWTQVADILAEVTGTKVRRASMPAARKTVVMFASLFTIQTSCTVKHLLPPVAPQTLVLHRSYPCNAPQHRT